MQMAATGLLVAMVALFGGMSMLAHLHPAFGYARAFAEAGMAGGVADWFAVTALFRRPLGLPLPHTAIIPRKKHRIAENLGRFFELNFLSDDVVAAKLAGIDLAGPLSRWVSEPQQIEQIADYLTALVPGKVDALDAQALDRLVRDAISARVREIDVASIAADVLPQLTQSIDYDTIIVAALDELNLLIEDNKDVIRGRVRSETGWILQRMSVDAKVADAIVKVLGDALDEIRATPDHPWRRRLSMLAHEQLLALSESPTYLAKWVALRDGMLQSDAFSERIGGMRRDLVESLRADARSPDSLVRTTLRATIEQLAGDASKDELLRARLNACAREAILDMMPALRHELGELIADTVSRWDAATATAKIELEIGRDLQFVRINGTLIGGLVGLLLHAVGALR
ncbi:DUF445 domain-containing protein [Burkholderia sp. WSM2230]|uniref:DUF445 domain-containing protein n=1 Tax=Burkholderia sp. WSM2230 TaxID=944435 RepID=UPI00042832C8|nr:DUF445 domain-containing protein [Burkholderia sp. WSM2230]